MELRADVTLPFPRDLVYATYRDHLADLTEYLPNIRSIKVLDRKERDGVVELVNEWVGGGEIPKVARAVLSEAMLRWTDYATWKQEGFLCEWRTEVGAFPGAVHSSGVNRYVEAPGGARMELRGTFVCDSGKLKGVPSFLAKTVNEAVEKLFVGKISENALAVGRGVGKYLEKHR